jgi:hypothetical protein
VPLDQVLRLRRAARCRDALVPDYAALSSRPDQLGNPELAALVANVEFDAWSLTPRTIDLLERLLRARRPAIVLEFGSGVSTVCTAYVLRALGGPPGVRIYSIDESPEFLERTRALLDAAGLGPLVAAAARPLVEQEIGGSRTSCYDLPPDFLGEFLGGARPDFVLVDGPSGGGEVRFGTLPLVAPFLAEGATFLLDDARRDGELRVAARWRALDGVRVEGVYAREKGLLVGSVA